MAVSGRESDAAIAAIGEGASDDFRLAPETHAAALPPEAGALARVLRRKTVEPLIQHFREADRAAIRAQARFKRFGVAIAWLRFLPVLVGGLVLLASLDVLGMKAALEPLAAQAGLGVDRALTAGVFLQFVLLFLATALNWIMNAGRFFEKWMRRRTDAETARLEYFYRIASAKEPTEEGEQALLPLQLEYFRRYQLDVQRAFYRIRARQHAAQAGQSNRAATQSGLLTVIASIPVFYGAVEFAAPGLLASFFELTPKNELPFVVLGMVLASWASSRAEIARLNMHERNAARYMLVSEDLEKFAGDPLAAARAAAVAGERESVLFFVDTVQGVVSSENQEWIHLWSLRKKLQGGGD